MCSSDPKTAAERATVQSLGVKMKQRSWGDAFRWKLDWQSWSKYQEGDKQRQAECEQARQRVPPQGLQGGLTTVVYKASRQDYGGVSGRSKFAILVKEEKQL